MTNPLLINLDRYLKEEEERLKQKIRFKKHTCSSSCSHSLLPKRCRVMFPASLPPLCSPVDEEESSYHDEVESTGDDEEESDDKEESSDDIDESMPAFVPSPMEGLIKESDIPQCDCSYNYEERWSEVSPKCIF